jgi:hypothetical protein
MRRGAGVVLALLALAGCNVDVDTYGPITLAATDPALLERGKMFVFSFSSTNRCGDLVNLDPAGIAAAVAAEQPPAPLQALEPRSGEAVEHVFGNVPPNVEVAFFVLASALGRADLPQQRVTIAALQGSVFAIGCRDFTAPSGTRHDLPLSLFPVGLR